MARNPTPDPLSRRHLIEKELPPERCLEVADAYLEAGRASEAVIFLTKAGADDRLDALAEQAVADGDAFLLRSIADATRRDPGPEQWRALAEAAERAGKALYADMALRHSRGSEE